MFFKNKLLSLRKIAVLLHKVAAEKLPLIVTSCQTSCIISVLGIRMRIRCLTQSIWNGRNGEAQSR